MCVLGGILGVGVVVKALLKLWQQQGAALLAEHRLSCSLSLPPHMFGCGSGGLAQAVAPPGVGGGEGQGAVLVEDSL